MTDDGWKGGQDSQAYVDHLKAEAMTDERDIDCPKCAKFGDDCGEHSPSWEELVDYWKNEAASLRKQLDDAGNVAIGQAIEALRSLPKDDGWEDMREVLRPFVDLKHQKGAWSIIQKAVSDFEPVTLTITKRQMLNLLAALGPLPAPPSD